MLKLSIPAEAGLFQPLVDHPKVLRVVALSGGFSPRPKPAASWRRNPGMIASFSRALAVGPARQQSDAEFDCDARQAIDEIYSASTSQGARLTVDEAEFDPIDFPPPERTEPAKLYLISPQEVGGDVS